jgi:hypothetical protein
MVLFNLWKLRYGIIPSGMDAGTAIINKSNAEQVIELTRQKYC